MDRAVSPADTVLLMRRIETETILPTPGVRREPTMPPESHNHNGRLTGHALRNAHLPQRSLERASTAPPLAQAVVRIRAGTLQMTRLELARRSGISRGALRDLELGIHTPTRQTLQQFVTFCQQRGVSDEELEALRCIYTGS